MIFFDFLKVKFCLKSNSKFRTNSTDRTDSAVAGLKTFLCENNIKILKTLRFIQGKFISKSKHQSKTQRIILFKHEFFCV